MAREDEIRLIAFNIWQEEGCLDGRDCEQWLRAEIIWEGKQKEKAPSTTFSAKSKQPVRQKPKITTTKKSK